MPEYRCADLLASPTMTAVVWRVAAGLLPGKALPPIVFPVSWKGYKRESDIHQYAYSVLLSTFFDASENTAREALHRVVGDTGCETELCRFLRRFWQESPQYLDDEKTGSAGKAVRFRLRRLWLTWQPERMADFLDFVRWSARRYAAHDPEIGWPAEVYRPQVTPVQPHTLAGGTT
ncbi:MAG: hypothetical protein HS108_10585 [Planctomycetes bacterium]|nr:hypothetical protein [Planctomycetota bacterium]MCL4731679.1 hypothetical protein [Planctomycetota bacterium]